MASPAGHRQGSTRWWQQSERRGERRSVYACMHDAGFQPGRLNVWGRAWGEPMDELFLLR